MPFVVVCHCGNVSNLIAIVSLFYTMIVNTAQKLSLFVKRDGNAGERCVAFSELWLRSLRVKMNFHSLAGTNLATTEPLGLQCCD